MTTVRTVECTSQGVLKNRKKYPFVISATHTQITQYAANNGVFNDFSTKEESHKFPSLILTELTPKSLEKLRVHLKFHHPSLHKFICEEADKGIKVRQVRTCNKILSCHTSLAFVFNTTDERNTLVNWLTQKLKDVDIYLDIIHVKQITALERQERADEAEFQLLLEQENAWNSNPENQAAVAA